MIAWRGRKRATVVSSANPSVFGQTVNFTDSSGSNPLSIMMANGSVIMAEVAYSYNSPTTQVITGSINMSNVWYTKPRQVAQIPKPASCP